MMSRIAFISQRISRNLGQSGSAIYVTWARVDGGEPDPTNNGAIIGGNTTILSGQMNCFAIEEPARAVVRQFTEIQAGDLIIDIDPKAMIQILPNQILSGSISLDDLAGQTVKFQWQNKQYEQKEVGDELVLINDAVFANRKLHRTCFLKIST